MWSQQEQRAKYAPHGMHRDGKTSGLLHLSQRRTGGVRTRRVTGHKKSSSPPSTAGVEETVH